MALRRRCVSRGSTPDPRHAEHAPLKGGLSECVDTQPSP